MKKKKVIKRGKTAKKSTTGKKAKAIKIPILHHALLKTSRMQEMIDWYAAVVGIEPVFQAPGIAFLSNDGANHRISLAGGRSFATTRNFAPTRVCTISLSSMRRSTTFLIPGSGFVTNPPAVRRCCRRDPRNRHDNVYYVDRDRNMRLVAVLVTKPLPGIKKVVDRRILESEMVQTRVGAKLRVVAKLRAASQRNPVIGAVVAEERDAGSLKHRLNADHASVPVDHLLHARGFQKRVMEYRDFDCFRFFAGCRFFGRFPAFNDFFLFHEFLLQASGNEQLHDLVGSGVDAQHPRIAIEPRYRIFVHIAVTAE